MTVCPVHQTRHPDTKPCAACVRDFADVQYEAGDDR